MGKIKGYLYHHWQRHLDAQMTVKTDSKLKTF